MLFEIDEEISLSLVFFAAICLPSTYIAPIASSNIGIRLVLSTISKTWK